MSSRVAQWAFVVVYAIIAVLAVWQGVIMISPPLPEATPFNPDPLPLLTNSAMVTASMFAFLTALLFAAVAFFAFRDTSAGRADGVVVGLNRAFAAFLAAVAAYLIYYGVILLSLGGSFAYALSGVALLASAYFILMRSSLGALIYAGVVAFWVVLSIVEAGFDLTALLPRLAAFLVVGLWFLSPWYGAAMGKTAEAPKATGGRWVGFAALAGALLLVAGSLQGYSVVEGTKNEVAADPAVTDWRNYGGVPEGQRFAQIDQINLENVGQLKEAWRTRTGVAYDFKQTPQMANGMLYICTAGNTLMALDADTGKKIWEYDTKTEVPGGMKSGSTFAKTCRGLGYHEAPATYVGECAKRVITGTTDARLIAVDAMTGRLCQSFGFSGEVYLVSGLGFAPLGNFMVTSTPLIAGDKVVVGGWVTDNQQIGNPSGVLRAYDAITGQFAWAWDMGNPGYQGLPDEGGEYTRGTPNVWSNTAYDPVLNYVFAPTGNSSPDYFDGDLRSKESEENASSVVAINAATGERVWVYQTVHRDIWDWDVPSQPVLVNVRKNGEGEIIPAVAQPTKRGEIFLLDRRTGKPIYLPETCSDGTAPVNGDECKVPGNPEKGEVVTATQPFSALPHFRDDRIEQDMWGLTPLDQLACRIEFKKMRYDGHFTPPMEGGGGYGQAEDSWGGTFQYPGNAGGFNWGSVSVDADNGLLVGAPMLMGNRIVLRSVEARKKERETNEKRLKDRDEARTPEEKAAAEKRIAEARAEMGPRPAPPSAEEVRQRQEHNKRFDQDRVLYRGDTAPFMSSWRLPIPFINIGTELPCFEPPFGQIGVIDLNTNKLLWKKPIGSMKHSGPFGVESGLPFIVGTPLQGASLTTRGGLIFHGGAMDSTLRAFDLRTGAVKWEGTLPGSAHASPMSYVGKNGKQYIVITVPNPSWRYPRPPSVEKPTDNEGGYVIAFALPDGAK